MRIVPMFAILAVLGGCCSYREPVALELTLSRLELPEPPSKRFRARLGTAKAAYVVLTPDQLTEPPSARNPELRNEKPVGDCDFDVYDLDELQMSGTGEVCFAERFSFGVGRRSGGPLMANARVYLLGKARDRSRKGDFSMALTGAAGKDGWRKRARDFDQQPYSTRVDRVEAQVGLVLGYRALDTLLVYGGPYELLTDYEFEYRQPSAAAQTGEGEVHIQGGHLGLAWLLGTRNSLMLEYSRAAVHAGDAEREMGRWSVQYQVDL